MTTNQKLWLKETRRIKNFIRRAKKRGYDFTKFTLPHKPKRITSQAIERLKKITPAELYKIATYKTPTGKTVSGERQRALERRVAAQKARYTKDLKKRVKKYIEENAKDVPEAVEGGQDYKEVKDDIILRDGIAFDPNTGEVLFELDSEGVVFSASDVINNFKDRLKGIDPKANYYKPLLIRWLDVLITVFGEEKVAMSLERLAHLDKLIYRVVKYENDFLFFTWEHMNNFILQGWLDRELAEEIMAEFTDNEDEYFSDGVVI